MTYSLTRMRTRYDTDSSKAYVKRLPVAPTITFHLIYFAWMADKLLRPDCGLFADKNHTYMELRDNLITHYFILEPDVDYVLRVQCYHLRGLLPSSPAAFEPVSTRRSG